MIRDINVSGRYLNSFIKVVLFTILLVSFPMCSWGGNQEDNLWVFYKVSRVNVFGSVNQEVKTQLEGIYSGVNVTTDNNLLKVNNDILESGEVCSIKYVAINKTPLSYYRSDKAVEMYKNQFASDDINLPNNLEVLTSLYPDDACQEPYSEFVVVGDLLVFTDEDFLIYLKKGISKNKPSNSDERKLIGAYCRAIEQLKEFDGSEDTSCLFKKMTLQEAYLKLINVNEYAHKYFRGNLPSSNVSYKKDNALIDYSWVGSQGFNVRVKNGGEIFLYLFLLVGDDTQLTIKAVTDY